MVKPPSTAGGIRSGEISITTGSRVHFGLLRSAAPFGGVGAMIDQPGHRVTIRPSDHWQCDGDHADRILPIAQRLMDHVEIPGLPACRVEVQSSMTAHCGLGSGTQLSLAIAEGLSRFMKQSIDPLVLAIQIADRGKRSAVGVHGYFEGGLIHEAPGLKAAGLKAAAEAEDDGDLNPVARRIELPTTWRVAFLLPPDSDETISGVQEAKCFSRLGKDSVLHVDRLHACLRDRLLPAAQSTDFKGFSQAIHDYNRDSGKLFASVQGGPYNGKAVTDVIERLQTLDIAGVGQSSWGPGVFAWFESQEQMDQFLSHPSPPYQVITTTQIKNTGRQIIDHDLADGSE